MEENPDNSQQDDASPLYFYRERDEPYGCFSNFSAHGFTDDGVKWSTAEHYFQAQKFAGTSHTEDVRRAKTPKEAKSIGGDRKRPLRPDWERVKDEVMRQAVRLKFQSHSDIRQVLLSTGDRPIVENAPRDYYWGCGAHGTGKNMLGKILVEIRKELRNRSE